MTEDFRIGKYKIETETLYTICFERRTTSDKDLKALDYNKDKTITENELQIFDLTEENTEISEEIKEKNAEKKSVEKEIKAEEKKLKQKQSELKKKANKYNGIFTSKKKKEELSKEIATLNTEINSIKRNIEKLNNKIKKIDDEIETCNKNIKKNKDLKADLIANKKQAKLQTKKEPEPVSKTTVYPSSPANSKSYNFQENLTTEQKNDLNTFKSNYTKNKDKYKEVENKTGVPSELVAAIHWRESSGNFKTYLHNGDPLGQPTVHVPKGKNFSDWTEAAIDALKSEDTSVIKKGDFDSYLAFAEKYNGLGYKNRNVKSPYVWSGTNQYTSGKFVADGKYDPEYKDKQLGVAVMLKNIL